MTDETPTHDAEEPTVEDYEAVVRAMQADGINIESSEGESEDPDVFPRDYVEDLRQENGKYRQRAQRADDLAHRLHTELVRATGKLADPTDIPFDETHLDEPDKLSTAVDELLVRKPHLASRRPVGDIGQGASESASTVDLAAILRQRAQ
jgi:hypothetical protein